MGGGYYIFFVIISCRFYRSLCSFWRERKEKWFVRREKKDDGGVPGSLLKARSSAIGLDHPHVRIIKRSLAN